jgi:hypothetical protein
VHNIASQNAIPGSFKTHLEMTLSLTEMQNGVGGFMSFFELRKSNFTFHLNCFVINYSVCNTQQLTVETKNTLRLMLPLIYNPLFNGNTSQMNEMNVFYEHKKGEI